MNGTVAPADTRQGADDLRRSIQFTVRGLPAPQGSKSFKGVSSRGHAILVESSKKVRPWRQDVVAAAEDAIRSSHGFTTFQGPVHLIVEFYLPRPKSAPKTRRTVPAVMPDLSKLVRSTEDALTTAAVWRDDSQVVDITTRKRFATFGDQAIGHEWELPGVGAVITVIELSEDDTWSDIPLDLHAALRNPAPRLPLILADTLCARTVKLEEWGSSVTVIPKSHTDAKVRTALAKITKESGARIEIRRSGAPYGHSWGALAVVIEDGANRLASVPGKPLTALQEDVIKIAKEASEYDTEIVIMFVDSIE